MLHRQLPQGHGFIQIPILLLILIATTVAGGVTYVAHEVNKPSEYTKPPTIQQEQFATTSTALEIIQEGTFKSSPSITPPLPKQKVPESIPDGKNATTKSIEEAPQEPTPKIVTKIVTLPSGAIIEIDDTGSVLKSIKQAPQPPESFPFSTTTSNPPAGPQSAQESPPAAQPKILSVDSFATSPSSLRKEFKIYDMTCTGRPADGLGYSYTRELWTAKCAIGGRYLEEQKLSDGSSQFEPKFALITLSSNDGFFEAANIHSSGTGRNEPYDQAFISGNPVTFSTTRSGSDDKQEWQVNYFPTNSSIEPYTFCFDGTPSCKGFLMTKTITFSANGITQEKTFTARVYATSTIQ